MIELKMPKPTPVTDSIVAMILAGNLHTEGDPTKKVLVVSTDLLEALAAENDLIVHRHPALKYPDDYIASFMGVRLVVAK